MIAIKRRKRECVSTWFNMNNEDDCELFHWIQDWKEHRKFLPYLRQALWLFIALMNGDLSTLIEYFPPVIERIRAPDKKRIVELEEKLKAAQERIEELEDKKDDKLDKILEAVKKQLVAPLQAATPLQAISPNQTPQNGTNQAMGGLRPITTQSVAAPSFDDEDDDLLEIKIDNEAGVRASANFLRSLQALNS